MFDLLEELKTLPHNPLFVKRYFNFLEVCKSRKFTGYKENHHILPKSIWGGYKSFSKNPWNKIRLSTREHYIAHFILAKCFTGKERYKMILALDSMRLKNKDTADRYFNSRLYAKLKEELRELQRFNNLGSKNPNFGKPRTEEVRRKISESEKGKVVSKETRELMSLAKKNKPLTDEHRSSISKSLIGREVSLETREKLSKSQSGSKGSNAKTYTIIDPYGKTYTITGRLKSFCVENHLSHMRIKGFINLGKIPSTNEESPNVTQESINCKDWTFKRH